MFIKILQEISKQDGNAFDKLKKLIEFKNFYKNLQNGIENQTIFHQLEKQNSDLLDLIHKFDKDDFELLDKLFKKDIKKFLTKNSLSKSLHFQKRQGSNQIGINAIFVEKPLVGLWTTGKANFYMPTKKFCQNTIIIELQSVVPLEIFIEFNGKQIRHEELSKLTTKKLEIKIPSTEVEESISEISINTNRLWLPNVILGIKESIKIGVKVDSISIVYEN